MVKSKRVLFTFVLLSVLSGACWHTQAAETADVGSVNETASLPLDLYQDFSKSLSEYEQRKLSAADFQIKVHPHEKTLRAVLKNGAMVIQRVLSARVLAFASEKESTVEALCAVLTADADDGVRAASAFSLGRLNEASAVEALIGALRDNAPAVREAIIAALGQLKDERAVPSLLQVLRYDRSHAVRMAAARNLALLPVQELEKDIAAIMETEPDERVRWMLAETLRLLKGVPQEEDADELSPDGFSQKLKVLASDMKDVEEKLRSDRHDSAVQNDQQDVAIKLAEMIRSLEDLEKMKAEPAQASKDGKKRWAQMASSGSAAQQTKASRALQSQPEQKEAAHLAARVAERRNMWAQLPPAARDEMLQVFRPEVPIRWRKRLEAYFLSVAAEEARQK